MAEFGGFESYVDKARRAKHSFGGNINKGVGTDFSGLFGGLTKSTEARGQELTAAAGDLFRGRAAGLRGTYEDSSSALTDRLSSQGIDPLFAQGAIEENRAGVASGIAEARGETGAQLHTALAGLLGEDIESRASLSLAQRQAKMTYYLARLQYHLAKKGQQLGVLGDVVGTGAAAYATFGGTTTPTPGAAAEAD